MATKKATKEAALKYRVTKQIKQYLDCLDCSSARHINDYGIFKPTFEYEEGLNEGCYMTIGDRVYRCHIKGHEARERYQNAVHYYVSMIPLS